MIHNIRNFCIIAHIDHGKSTLADRLLEFTNTVKKRNITQLLDNMDLERERGITIKSHAVQMNYEYKKKIYTLNLIDTPGHVDFSYEVSRSISACEGALLIIDCTKNIQAQTISNFSLAKKKKLTIIPILNKIDLIDYYENVLNDISNLVECKKEDIITISAKNGLGIHNVLNRIITDIPPPNGNRKSPLQAIIFDSSYNPFKGVEIFFKIKNGFMYKKQKLQFFSTKKKCYAHEIGNLRIKKIPKKIVDTGDVGYLISGIKNVHDVKVGDTIIDVNFPSRYPVEKFTKIKPMIFASIYPSNSKEYEDLHNSIEKLKLNDSSISFTTEFSSVLGSGFRCGFLGLLHMEIVKDRLKREYGISIIITIPNVSYKIYNKDGSMTIINNPSKFPDSKPLKKIEEPYVLLSILTNKEYLGNIISLCVEKKRGVMLTQDFINSDRIKITFEIPLSEIIFDFYDKLKTISKGYASFDYYFIDYKKSDLKKIVILINYEKIEALSILSHKNKVKILSRKICKKLSSLIPKHQFHIPIQASVSGKIIARETIKALRKNVTGKCYGGDVSRKKKLLSKQKKGKKKMGTLGKVRIPSSTFISFLRIKE